VALKIKMNIYNNNNTNNGVRRDGIPVLRYLASHFLTSLSLSLILLLLATINSSNVNADDSVTPDSTTSEQTTSPDAQTQPDQAATPSATEDPFVAAIDLLKESSFTKKGQAVDLLLNIDDPRTLKVLKYLGNSNIYYRKEDKLLVYLDETGGSYTATDIKTEESLGNIEKSDFKKVVVNNKMRREIDGAIAQLSLGNKDPDVRFSAVREMLGDPSPDRVSMIRGLIEKETDSDVQDIMQTLLSLADIKNPDKTVRIDAIKQLSGNLENEVFIQLSRLVQKDENGAYLESDADIVEAATGAINGIKDRRGFFDFIKTIFFGLSLGSVLLLAAIGLAITFGVMGVINMAHGELIMLGAYTTYIIQQIMPNHIGASLFIAIPAAFIVSGLVGIAIERGVIRHMYGRPLDTLLATFGISLILQQAVRVGISAQNVPVKTPDWMAGTLEINPAFALTFNRLYILIFGVMVFFALMTILKKTSLGLQVRAVSQNRAMARAMGVRSEWVDALTFGLGSGIAGVAGVALSQLTNVGPNLGQAYIIDSFMVVVFGGVGNLWGTLVGSMSLGVINKFLEPWAGAVLAKILVLIFIILFIQKKPRGLFPQKGRAAEN